ncbi:MAG: Kelch repeat-containing protein [Polyangiales bacterium]
MRKLLPLAALLSTACTTSAGERAPRSDAAPARATLAEVRAVSAFAQMGKASKLSIALPARTSAPMRVAHAGVSLDLTGDLPDAETTVVDGAAIARVSPHLDVLFAPAGDRAEEVRVLRDEQAETTLRWNLHVEGATAELETDHVNLVDARHVPRLVIAPLFAVDARGARRDLSLDLARVDATHWKLEARLDTKDLAYPIYVDPSVWAGTEPMKIARIGHTATLLADGKVLVVGGAAAEDGPSVASAEIYSVTDASWTTVASMADARVHHTATKLADGKVLVVGGSKNHGAGPALSTAEIYDPVADTWTKTTGALPVERSWHSAIALSDGSVLVAGGSRGVTGDPSDLSLPPVTFDPATKTFTSMTGYGVNVPTAAVSVSLAGDTAIYFGGLVPPAGCVKPCTVDSTTDVIAYEGSPKKFTKVGSLRRKRAFGFDEPLVAASGFGTGVLVIGGGDDSGEVWSKDSGAWAATAGGELSDPWSAPTMVTTPVGDAVAIGGFVSSPGFPATPIKLFPTTLLRHHSIGRWADGTPPSQRRWSHTATVLVDGRILIAGGQNKDAVLPTAEIWHALDLGEACVRGGDCGSSFCVDGVCCEAACGDECEACNAAGKCVPVTGTPRGLRPLCVDPGGDVCKAEVCNGVATDKCNLPKGNRCSPASCSGSTFSPEATCDGAGGCTKPTAQECKPFGCTESGCRTACTTASECANCFVCADGKCIEQSGTTCKPDLTAAISKGGNEQPCAPYLCKLSSGACGDTCTGSGDCAGGSVCNSGRCEAPAASDSGGGCNAGRASRASGAVLALLALSMIARRRR